jgi:hypothetical protein
MNSSSSSSTPAVEQWISVAQRSARRHLTPALFVLGVLEVGALAVSQRSVLCQLQAYAILFVSSVGFVSYAYYNAERRECNIETFTQPYCVDCKGETRGVMVVGRRVGEVPSSYERLYANPLRAHFAIFAWLAWVAYGSVFHEAQHTASEDAYVTELVHGLTSGPWLDSLLPHVRTLRIVALFAVACYDSSTYGASHVVYTTTVFFALLFFPSSQSTAQALHTVELLSRTAVFTTLFVLAELTERAEHYRDWLGNYGLSYKIHLTGVLMAIGRAKPLRPESENKSEDIFIPVCGPDSVGRSFSIERHLASWRIIVRSAWILVASDAAIGLAIVESFYLLYRLLVARQPLAPFAAANSSFLRPKSPREASRPNRGSRRSLSQLSAQRQDIVVLQPEIATHSGSSRNKHSASSLSFPATQRTLSPPPPQPLHSSPVIVSKRPRRSAAAVVTAAAAAATDPEDSLMRPSTPSPTQMPLAVAEALELLARNNNNSTNTQDAYSQMADLERGETQPKLSELTSAPQQTRRLQRV